MNIAHIDVCSYGLCGNGNADIYNLYYYVIGIIQNTTMFHQFSSCNIDNIFDMVDINPVSSPLYGEGVLDLIRNYAKLTKFARIDMHLLVGICIL